MRVQATKKMATELNRELKRRGRDDMRFTVVDFLPEDYRWHVGGYYWQYGVDEVWVDDENGGAWRTRTIKAYYPDEFYACPQYLNTPDLQKIFSAGDSWEDFASKVFNAMAV